MGTYRMPNECRIEFYAAVKETTPVPGLEGIAIADAVSGLCRIYGISVGFSGKLREITLEPEPYVNVYDTNKGRYLENFNNLLVADNIILEARQKGYFLASLAKPRFLKMPASFALPTHSQKELAAGISEWLGQNIETLVRILILKGESQSITARDAYSVPPSFRRLGENLLHNTLNLSFDESYKSRPDLTLVEKIYERRVKEAVYQSPHTKRCSLLQRKVIFPNRPVVHRRKN